MIADSVLMSMPCSSAVVAKVWRRSWKRTRLHCALSRIFTILRYTLVGSIGSPSLTGEGNIHSESTFFLYSLSTFSTDGGRMTERFDCFVLGTDTITPWST